MPDLLTPWTGRDYGPTLYGNPGAKLADSGVAPLIAYARGYRTVTSAAELKVAKSLRETKRSGRTNRQEETILTLGGAGGDTLVLPWFASDAVAFSGIEAASRASQFRLSTPQKNSDGKVRKYEFRNEDPTVVDLHPATAPEWLTSAPSILLIEGLAKGDSALTAIFRSAGISDEELSIMPGEQREDALRRLRGLYDRVPEADRCLVASIAGVENWRGDIRQWKELRPKGRTALVAFDGDLRTNARVWSAANRLFDFLRERAASPVLLDLGSPTVLAEQEAQDPGITKRMDDYVDDAGHRKRLGLDDYLTRFGDWPMAMELAVDRLPEKPAMGDEQPRIGQWRVGAGGTYTEEYVRATSSDPSDPGGRWDYRSGIGGRIVSVESSRAPQSNERVDGLIAEELPADFYETTATIELSWENQDGSTSSQKVTGPGDMLVTGPTDWSRKGIRLPAEVLKHPEFPPRDGLGWLSAIKSHRQDETITYNGWMVMGWVPTDTGIPAFIIGDQVLASTEAEEGDIRPCVTDRVLPGASKFGVVDTFRSVELDEYKRQIREDIEQLHFHHWASGAILDEAVASIVVGGMYRPTIPLESPGSIYFYGPPGRGKSFFASGIMAAWQSRPNTWNENQLPGQASDTPTARELALSCVPVWVSDDWAVTADANTARAQEGGMEAAIRSSFNNSGKRRSANSGASLAEQHSPIAEFVGTGENELTVHSIRDRCLMVNVGGPAPIFGVEDAERGIDPVDELRDFWVNSLVPARLCAAMIRFWTTEEIVGVASWEDRLAVARGTRKAAQASALADIVAQGVDQARSNRPVRNAAEIGMVFRILHSLGLWAGMDPSHPAMQRFDPESGFSAARAVHRLAASNARRQATSTPGLSLLQAIHAALQRGKAHVVNPDRSGEPPFAATIPDADALNVALGWVKDPKTDVWVGRGDAIGFIHEHKGERMVMLQRESAFDVARRSTEGLILPGSRASTMFQSMWTEGLCATVYSQKPSQVTIQVTPAAPSGGGVEQPRSATARQSGVPILLDPLVNPSAWTEQREQRAVEEAKRKAAESAVAAGEEEFELL